MRVRILYRDFDMADDERTAIAKYFPGDAATDSRMDIRAGDLVIGRYSVLPFYAEQERDIKRAGARMLVSHVKHRFIAEMEWVRTLRNHTPFTWFRVHDLAMDAPGSFVVKGVTNSRKHKWDTHMFARTRADVGAVVARLLDDTMIGQQDIVVRQYVPLMTYMHGIGGVPITREFRFFMAGTRVLAKGYYWASHAFDVASMCACGHTEAVHRVCDISQTGRVTTSCTYFGHRFGCGYEPAACSCANYLHDPGGTPTVEEVPQTFIDLVAAQLDAVPLYVMDVAQTLDGDWIVVELNDLQMSGLAMCDPDELYRNLADHLKEKTGGPP